MQLGRNQLLAVFGYGVPFLLSVLFVFTGQVSGKEWLDWVVVFVPVGVGITNGLSAATKILEPKEPQA